MNKHTVEVFTGILILLFVGTYYPKFVVWFLVLTLTSIILINGNTIISNLQS